MSNEVESDSTFPEKQLTIDCKDDSDSQIVPSLEPFNLEKEQAQTRGTLARLLIYSLISSLVFSFSLATIVFWRSSEVSQDFVKDIIVIILTSQTGLVGTVLGFYFGKNS